jgi:hypothetical protein
MTEFYNKGQLNNPAENPPNPAEVLPLGDICDEIIEHWGNDRSNTNNHRFDAIWSDDDLGLRMQLVKVVKDYESEYLLSVATQFEREPHLWYALRGTPHTAQVCDSKWKKERHQPQPKDTERIMRTYLVTAPVQFSGRYSREAVNKRFDELKCIYALTSERVQPHIRRLLSNPIDQERRLDRMRAKSALRTQVEITGKQALWALRVARELDFPETKND